MVKIRNPIREKVAVRGAPGYATQLVVLGKNSYVKIWRYNEVIDRALTVRKARQRALQYFAQDSGELFAHKQT